VSNCGRCVVIWSGGEAQAIAGRSLVLGVSVQSIPYVFDAPHILLDHEVRKTSQTPKNVLFIMELYRQIYGPHQSCHSLEFLAQILRKGIPDVNTAYPRIDDLQKRERIVFYPSSRMRELFANEATVTKILECRCATCIRHLRFSRTDLDEMVKSVLDKRKPKVILLAVLVYLGRSYMIKVLSRFVGLDDTELRSLRRSTLAESTWAELLDTEAKAGSLSREGSRVLDCFLENYESVVNLFSLPEFSTRSAWTCEYSSGQRFPFIDEEAHREGSFGEVRRFNIHSDYLDIEDKYSKNLWYTSETKVSVSYAPIRFPANLTKAQICSQDS